MEKDIVIVELTTSEFRDKYAILAKAVDEVLKVKSEHDKAIYSLKSFPEDFKLSFSEVQLYVANNFLGDLFFRRISNIVFDTYPHILDIDNKFDEFVVGDKDFSEWCEKHVPGAAAANKLLDGFYEGEYFDNLMNLTLKSKKQEIIKNYKQNKKEIEDVKTQKARNVVDGEIIANVSKNGEEYVATSLDGKDLTLTVGNQAKLKYAFDNNGVVRGRLKNDVLVWRVVKEKFVSNPLPTAEEVEEQLTREQNEQVKQELEVN